MSDPSSTPETPVTERDLRLARQAVDRGWISLFDLEEALKETQKAPGADLLTRLKITEERVRELEKPTHRTATRASAPPADVLEAMKDPTKKVGRYWVVSHLKSGGMGMVFRGWDPELGRKVALKFLKSIGDDTSRAYFRREAQLAAALDHPNIAKIYEIGEHEMSPYIAMQFIDGDSLAGAGSKMKLEEKLEATKRIAEAVKFAHQRQVIHRDLKPANVMIDRMGQVYVMDFGLAKETSVEGESLGGSNAVVGTPSYMAPEQVLGKADEQSDIYGIGAILYELVTGRPPFTGESPADIMMQVAQQELVWPRKLAPKTPEDLEAILLKALEKEKSRRYANAAELLEDLAAFERREPLLHARRPTLTYVLSKKIRRNPLPWMLSAALGMAVVGGAIFGAYTLIQRNRALLERSRLEKQNAIDQELAARREERQYWISKLATEVMEAKRVLRSDKPHARSREPLERLVSTLSDFIKAWPEWPVGYYVRARAEYYLGHIEKAEADLEETLKLSNQYFPLAWTLRGVILIDRHLEWKFGDMGTEETQKKEADRLLEEGLQALRKGWRSDKGDLWGLAPYVEDRVSVEIGEALFAENRGQIRSASDILESAWQKYRAEELLLFRSLQQADDKNAIKLLNSAIERAPGYAEAYYLRGARLGRLDDFDHAVRDFDTCLLLRPENAHACLYRGVLRSTMLEDYQGALEDYSRAIRISPRFSLAYCNRANRKAALGLRESLRIVAPGISLSLPGALVDYTEAIRLEPEYGAAYKARGDTLYHLHRYAEAIKDYSRTVEIVPRYVEGHYWRAQCHYLLKDYEEAIEGFSKTVELDPKHAEAFHWRGHCLYQLKRYDESIKDYSRAIALKPDLRQAYYFRGLCRYSLGRNQEAIQDFSAELMRNPDHAESYLYRGYSLSALKNYDSAIEDFDRALQIRPEYWEACYQRGLSKYNKNDINGALADFTRVLRLKPDYGEAAYWRAYLTFVHLKDGKEALKDLDECIRLNPRDADALYLRGYIRYSLGDSSSALQDFNRSIELKDAAETRYWRAASKYVRGEFADAIVDYSRALELRKDHPETYYWRGGARLETGDLEGALADFSKAIELKQDWAEAYFQRALTLKRKHDLDGCLSDLTISLKIKPDYHRARAYRGYLQFDRRMWSESIDDLRKVIEAGYEDQDYPRIYIWLTRARRGESDAATDELRSYLKDRRTDGMGDWPLSIAKFLIGDLSESNLFQAALTDDKNRSLNQRGESCFYAGMKRLLSGDREGALAHFRECLKTGARGLAEYWSADAEIRALER